MADELLHLQVVIEGGYLASDVAIANEEWAVSTRCLVTLQGSPDPVGTLPTEFSVVSASLSDSDTNWTASSNWRLEGGVTDFDPLSYLVDQVLPAATAWMNVAVQSGRSQIKALKVYAIGVNGKAIAPPPFLLGSPAVLTYIGETGPRGTGSSGLLPLQVALVASHRTPQVGRRGQGRMFRPALDGTVLSATGVLASGKAAVAGAAQVAWLEGLQVTQTNPGALTVRPAVITNTGTTAFPQMNYYSIINSVRIGSVPDTQRRRRNALVEQYSSYPVST